MRSAQTVQEGLEALRELDVSMSRLQPLTVDRLPEARRLIISAIFSLANNQQTSPNAPESFWANGILGRLDSFTGEYAEISMILRSIVERLHIRNLNLAQAEASQNKHGEVGKLTGRDICDLIRIPYNQQSLRILGIEVLPTLLKYGASSEEFIVLANKYGLDQAGAELIYDYCVTHKSGLYASNADNTESEPGI